MISKNNFRLRNACLSIPTSSFKDWKDQKFFKYLQELPYLRDEKSSYFVFQRELSNEKGEHWQCYLEFDQQVYFNNLQRDFRFSHLEKRKESQERAVKYCQKERSRIAGPYERGTLKRKPRGRLNSEQSLQAIITKIKSGEYRDFFAIADDNEILFEEKKSFLKTFWNHYHPPVFWETKPAQVIWCYGEKGAGKSVWTEKYLRMANYRPREVVAIFPTSINYHDQVRFEIDDEQGRVLVINEVDKDFPKNNNLINFIDRKGFLDTKESRIKNNFELIIINSLYQPEEVFSYLGKQVAGQVLRRIFSPYFQCKVYEIKENRAQLEKLLREEQKMTSREFQDWYQPILHERKTVNYQLIKKK